MQWNGFNADEFIFENHEAIIVEPEKVADKCALILKTEYWNAFPETEIKLIEKGHFLCYIKNDNRWGTDADIDRKARFVKFCKEKYNINCGCVPVGMSCGGIFAVKFAAKYPQLVSSIYIDAPVINYMSCPCGFGIGERIDDENFSEILGALNMHSISQLICYRETPQDKIPELLKHKIPVIMVAGDSDTVVPYTENGKLIEEAYKENSLPLDLFIKPGCNHHPHGLNEPSLVVECIEKYL
ncbi:MAG: hypothetical protein IJ025_04900 [Clostridia bacterium]|nr:hypothetical protein [Clostridia bacterium]